MTKLCVAFLAALSAAAPSAALAWGASGHRMLSQVGAQAFPDELPPFLRTGGAIAEITALSVEPDRSKDAGPARDADGNPGHYVNPDDNGAVLGGPQLDALPATREAYDSALRAVDATQYRAGYLPYSIIEGWQQLRKDFALWRAAELGERTAVDAAARARFAMDRALRERMILRDIGVWSHYVGDASQPLHVTVHYNGWGNYPNPQGFTTARIHGPIEGEFVRAHVTASDVARELPAFTDCQCPIEKRVSAYLAKTQSEVVPLYEIEKVGGFREATPAATAFIAERLAAGAAELRDMVVMAWRTSPDATVGYPPKTFKAIEAQGSISQAQLFGAD